MNCGLSFTGTDGQIHICDANHGHKGLCYCDAHHIFQADIDYPQGLETVA